MNVDLFGNPIHHRSDLDIKSKDWTGNANSIFKALAASNHTKDKRQGFDYYATDPKAAFMLLDIEDFSQNILEPCCGGGHIALSLEKMGKNVTSSDLNDTGFGDNGINFLTDIKSFDGDIITNPPYSMAKEFIEHSLKIVPDGRKVAMFLKIQFLESIDRRSFFQNNPPKTVHISSSRIMCAKNGDFEKYGSSAVCYAWYVWQKGYKGITELKWFN